jgi:hypothetical protein
MIWSIAILVPAAFLAVVVCLWFLRSQPTDCKHLAEFASEGSLADRYQPLTRLLQKTDIDYLSAQRGITPARMRRFRQERRRLFRNYLSSLISDFGGLCVLIRTLMVQSAVDRSDLAETMGTVRRKFYFAVLKIQFRLAIETLGLSTEGIEVPDLMSAFEALTAQARILQMTAETSLA